MASTIEDLMSFATAAAITEAIKKNAIELSQADVFSVGGVPGTPVDVKWKMKAGTVSQAATGNGFITVTFPVPYDRGLLGVLILSETPMLRRTLALNTFEVRRRDGRNISTTFNWFALGY